MMQIGLITVIAQSASAVKKPNISVFFVTCEIRRGRQRLCILLHVITEDSRRLRVISEITRCHLSRWLTCFPATREKKDIIKPVV